MNPLPDPAGGLNYSTAGVRTFEETGGLRGLIEAVTSTFRHRPSGRGRVILPIGYFANIIELTPDLGLALSADGVGTKILIAEMLHKFDTIGIDCVAMNVNDLICVGAEPLAILDYVAVEVAHPELLTEIAQGLAEGARQANVTIPGGEIAQIAEMIRGVQPGTGIDLVAAAVGTVPLDRVIVGQAIVEGDVVIGLPSSGIHSNGLTLARRALLDRAGWDVFDYRPELGRTIGEELLEPTRIYVREALAVIESGVAVRAIAHITGDGFLNLARVSAPAGFVLDGLPDPPPIFPLIQTAGGIETAEMYRVFNHGIGLCLVVAAADADRAETVLRDAGAAPLRIGHAIADDRRRVYLPRAGLVGFEGRFQADSGTSPRDR